MSPTPVEHLLIPSAARIREAMACIDRNEKGIALVVDEQRRLAGTVTDGDIRRAILGGLSIDEPVGAILARKAAGGADKPIYATKEATTEQLLALMRATTVRQVPILDEEGRVLRLVTLADLLPAPDALPMRAVIMAGGFGKRLAPLTEDTPKPMLPLGEKPVMEHIVDQLRAAGIHRLNVTTHFKPEKIRAHFGDGSRFGVDIAYVNEEQPLGTAGALGLLAPADEPLLVMNGDIVTRIDLRAMLAFHREHQAELTVGVRQYELEVPYGVLECDGARVTAIREKPSLRFFVNAGIYLLEPAAQRCIEPGRRCDMTDLIEDLLAQGRAVVSFPIIEYWLDVGQHQDYARAQRDAAAREQQR